LGLSFAGGWAEFDSPASFGCTWGESFSFLNFPQPALYPHDGHLIAPSGPNVKPSPDRFSVIKGLVKWNPQFGHTTVVIFPLNSATPLKKIILEHEENPSLFTRKGRDA
jgi:hypothetical protein